MYGIGILFSELAHEAQGSMLERIWPVFLVVVVLAGVAAVYFAVRQDKPDSDEDNE